MGDLKWPPGFNRSDFRGRATKIAFLACHLFWYDFGHETQYPAASLGCDLPTACGRELHSRSLESTQVAARNLGSKRRRQAVQAAAGDNEPSTCRTNPRHFVTHARLPRIHVHRPDGAVRVRIPTSPQWIHTWLARCLGLNRGARMARLASSHSNLVTGA